MGYETWSEIASSQAVFLYNIQDFRLWYQNHYEKPALLSLETANFHKFDCLKNQKPIT